MATDVKGNPINDIADALRKAAPLLQRELGKQVLHNLTTPEGWLGFNPSTLMPNPSARPGGPPPQPAAPTLKTVSGAIQSPIGQTNSMSSTGSITGGSGYDPVVEMQGLIQKAMADFPTAKGMTADQIAAFFAPYSAAIEGLKPPEDQPVPERQKALPTFIAAALSNIGSALSRNPEFAHATMEGIQQREQQRLAMISSNYMQKQLFDKDKQLQRLGAVGQLANAQFENAMKVNDSEAALKAQKVITKLDAEKAAVEAKARLEEQKVQSAATIKASENRASGQPKLMDQKTYTAAFSKIAMANEKNLPEAVTGLAEGASDFFSGLGLGLPKNFTKDDMYARVAAGALLSGDDEVKQRAQADLFKLARRKLHMPDTGAPPTPAEIKRMAPFMAQLGLQF